MRRRSTFAASRNAARFSSSVPCTAAGSATPQWAVMGLPGHTGHTSPAALSQTVMMKSIRGAHASAYTSQALLRNSCVGSPARWRNSIANGFTWPVGWLPAE